MKQTPAMGVKPVVRAPVAAVAPLPARKQQSSSKAVICHALPPIVAEMRTWNPINNKYFETFSYMPDLTDAEIRKIVVNYVAKGFIPAIEFAEPDLAYTVPAAWCDSNWRSGLYDNRYWTLWKLPFFNIPMEAGDVQESGVDFVMSQKGEIAGTFPDCYARMIFFDPARQVQVLSFLIQRPPNDTLRAPMELRRKPATPANWESEIDKLNLAESAKGISKGKD